MASRGRFAAASEPAIFFPASVRGESPNWFEAQQVLNIYLNNRVAPPPPLPGVNYILSGTDLRILPLWLMAPRLYSPSILAKSSMETACLARSSGRVT